MNAIYFDMDGTIADLYGVTDWLPKLQASDISPYVEAAPLVDMVELNAMMEKFAAIGFVVGVISWSAMNGSKEYNKQTRAAKKAWIDRHFPSVSEFHVVKYGTSKHTVAKVRGSVLIDDNAEVRTAWEHYTEENTTIDATNSEEMMEKLQKLLDKVA